MNTVLSNYGQLCGCPETLKKSCKFFCRGLDIRVPQTMQRDIRKRLFVRFIVPAENVLEYAIGCGWIHLQAVPLDKEELPAFPLVPD